MGRFFIRELATVEERMNLVLCLPYVLGKVGVRFCHLFAVCVERGLLI